MDTSLKGSCSLTPYCSDPQLVLRALGTLNSDPASCSRGRWPEGSFRTCPQLHTRPSLSAHPPASSCPQRAFLAPLPAQQDAAFRESSTAWRDRGFSHSPLWHQCPQLAFFQGHLFSQETHFVRDFRWRAWKIWGAGCCYVTWRTAHNCCRRPPDSLGRVQAALSKFCSMSHSDVEDGPGVSCPDLYLHSRRGGRSRG